MAYRCQQNVLKCSLAHHTWNSGCDSEVDPGWRLGLLQSSLLNKSSSNFCVSHRGVVVVAVRIPGPPPPPLVIKLFSGVDYVKQPCFVRSPTRPKTAQRGKQPTQLNNCTTAPKRCTPITKHKLDHEVCLNSLLPEGGAESRSCSPGIHHRFFALNKTNCLDTQSIINNSVSSFFLRLVHFQTEDPGESML